MPPHRAQAHLKRGAGHLVVAAHNALVDLAVVPQHGKVAREVEQVPLEQLLPLVFDGILVVQSITEHEVELDAAVG